MNLVLIDKENFDVELDIRYSTRNNFIGKVIYKSPLCYLHNSAAIKLKKSIMLASQIGLKIKIFDGFRPLEAQNRLWDFMPNPNYVSSPTTGLLPHCRAVALDLTLIDSKGDELDMGTEFDCFSIKSHHGAEGLTKNQISNRLNLAGIMFLSGWEFNPNEWWHYQLPNIKNYSVLNDENVITKMLLD